MLSGRQPSRRGAAGGSGRLRAGPADVASAGTGPRGVLVRARGVRRGGHAGLRRGDPAAELLRVAAGLDPCEALVSFAAIGAAPEETFASRGWSAPDWAAARDWLAARRWIDASGTATERGRDGRDEIEWRTDRLADAPWRALGPARAQRLAELAGPILGAAFESGLLPSQSTLG